MTAAAEMLAAMVIKTTTAAASMTVTAMAMTTTATMMMAAAVAVATDNAVGIIKTCMLKLVMFLPSPALPTTRAVVGGCPNQAHASSPMVWG